MNITILNANLWLLPPPAAADNSARLDAFISLAKKLSPDAINLQEVWLKSYVHKITKSLQEYHVVSPKSLILNKSGLVTLTKSKPLGSEFEQFAKHHDFDAVEKVASKGYLRTTFDKDGKVITLINTHIYETLDQVKLKIKFGQIKDLLKRALEHNPTIIAGDFNAEPGQLPNWFSALAGECNHGDTYSLENKYAHALINGIMNRKGVHYAKPDYVFANIKGATIHSEVIKKPLVSDHYPVFATITTPDA